MSPQAVERLGQWLRWADAQRRDSACDEAIERWQRGEAPPTMTEHPNSAERLMGRAAIRDGRSAKPA